MPGEQSKKNQPRRRASAKAGGRKGAPKKQAQAGARRRAAPSRGGRGPQRNPMHQSASAPVPSPFVEGKAFAIRDVVRADISSHATNPYIMIVSNTGTAATVAMLVNLSGASPAVSVLNVPTVAAADDAGGPTSGRAMRCSVGLVNTTPMLNRGGRVFTLNANQRFALLAQPTLMTAAQWLTFASEVRSHPNTKAHDATTFGKELHMVAHTVDQTEYLCFNEWMGSVTADVFASHIAIWPSAGVRERPMSTVVILVDPVSTTNTYTASVHAEYYTRWPLNTVMGKHMKPIPTAPVAQVNAINQHAQASADVLHTAEGVAVGGGLLAGLSRYGGAAASALSRAAAPIAADAELLAPLLPFVALA